MKRIVAATMAVLLVTAAAVPAATATTGTTAATDASNQSAEAFAGAHVSFQTDGSAITNYSVDGATIAENVTVESRSTYVSRLGLGADVRLSAVTNLVGASTSLSAETETSATVATGGSAELRAHDSDHGQLVVDAGGESQYVQANLTEGAETEQHGESRLTVETADGSEATFIVAGDGEVTANEDGDVAASLSEDAQLVVRSYDESRDENDEQIEQYVANGTATAEAYVTERSGEIVNSTIAYGQETTVEASQTAESEVTFTVDRTESEGKILVTSVSEAAVGSVEDLNVTVDGEAAAEVESYSELEGAIGEEPRYMVVSEGSADADATVLVGIDHFSEREVTMSGDDSGSDDGLPGFGVLAGLTALLGAAGIARRR
ncbi:PGF-CTERM sorting domain-containing protein [Natronoarchaeum rubrum]|uniref:PGF-CTERM sorting domain-containing protein n=1 Tax=Natronoarchaeum rubrum TaxID=755311 RepID=UPI002111A01B|nr:PGF-CTERM sorting domain-containing protein [Natronoarchaeum rubrum]